jgi:RNA polymerase sigma-70 factor (ECF subfamily)
MYAKGSLEAAFQAYRERRDPAALAAVYDGASSRLLAVALHLSHTVVGAEDAVQETFLVALQHPERWDPTRPLFPWLLGILGHKLHKSDAFGRRAPDPDRLHLPPARDPEAELATSETLARIERAITELPQPYRAVVLLRLRNGLCPADIAVALGRKPSTVRAQLTRGVEMLRKALPASVAALLVGSATAARGLDAARDVVLAEAARRHRAFRWQGLGGRLRVAALAAAGIAVTIAAFGLWPTATVPPADATAVDTATLEPEATTVREVSLPSPAPTAPGIDRSEARPAGSLAVVVRRNGSPLPGANVEIEPLGDPPRAFEHRTSGWVGPRREIVAARPCARDALRYGRTDADGRCVLPDVPSGLWICRALDAVDVVDVAPATVTRLDLAADPRTCVVRGIVLDAAGRPVPDAPLWSCDELRLHGARVFGHSDDHGRFLVAAAPQTTVGALLPDHAPVGVTVRARDGAPFRDVVLQLSAPGARLSGTVHDAAGRPLAGALVEVGHANDARVVPAAAPVVLARRQHTVTDHEGRYAFAALAPGTTVLLARADGHGVQRCVVDLAAGAANETALQLTPAAALQGRVRTSDGAPVVGAVVQIGRRGNLAHCTTVTDRDGVYHLDGITPGRPTVEVVDYRGGFVAREIDCAPGQRCTWDAILAPDDLQVSGTVRDHMGRPFAHGWVVHSRLGNLVAHRLDASGRFTLLLSERDAALPYEVEVFDQDPLDAAGNPIADPLAALPGPPAGTRDATLHLPPRVVADAWLHGRLVDATGAPRREPLRVVDADARHVFRIGTVQPAADGTFTVGPLVAGRYRLVAARDDHHHLGAVDVRAGAQHQLGDLVVAAAPALTPLRLAALFPDDVARTEPFTVEVHDAAGRLRESRRRPGSIDGSAYFQVLLPPGTYTLSAVTTSGREAHARVTVDAAVPTRALVLSFGPR